MVTSVRARRPGDVPTLVDLLAAQRLTSGYPHVWPLPFPVEDFVVRSRELAAWVAVQEDEIVGHVCVQRAPGGNDPLTALWSAAHSVPAERLGILSALFTSTAARGTGVGRLLLGTAVGWLHAHDLAPCLDVVPGPSPAIAVYRHLGWTPAGEARPDWLGDDEPSVVAMILR